MTRRRSFFAGGQLWTWTTVVGALCALLVATGCASGDASSPSAPPASASISDRVKGTEIVVAVVKGNVVPATHRVKVSKHTHIRLLVTSDKADEVHVHGYDIEHELKAHTQATIEFVADQAGLFEIETHKSGLALVQLEVR